VPTSLWKCVEIHQPILDTGFRNAEASDRLTNYSAQVVLITTTLQPTIMSTLCSFIKLRLFFTARAIINRMNISYQVNILKNIIKEFTAILKEEEQKSDTNRIMVYCRSITETRLSQSEVNARTDDLYLGAIPYIVEHDTSVEYTSWK